MTQYPCVTASYKTIAFGVQNHLIVYRVGIVSGKYIFAVPLAQYWKEQQQEAVKGGVHKPVVSEVASSDSKPESQN